MDELKMAYPPDFPAQLQPEKDPAIRSLYDTNVYADLTAYLRELFAERGADITGIEVTADMLASDLTARFGKKYQPEAIVHLLGNGFRQITGTYLFMRDDFWKEEPKDEVS